MRGRGGGREKRSEREKGKGKEKEKNTRSEFGSPKEGWIDVGSNVKMSISMKSQVEYIMKNRHVSRNFI